MENENRKARPAWVPQLLLLALSQTRVTCFRELVLELLDAACGVDELQLARKEWVALTANVDLQFLPRAARGEGVSATAMNVRFNVFGMNALFHGVCDSTEVSPVNSARMPTSK